MNKTVSFTAFIFCRFVDLYFIYKCKTLFWLLNIQFIVYTFFLLDTNFYLFICLQANLLEHILQNCYNAKNTFTLANKQDVTRYNNHYVSCITIHSSQQIESQTHLHLQMACEQSFNKANQSFALVRRWCALSAHDTQKRSFWFLVAKTKLCKNEIFASNCFVTALVLLWLNSYSGYQNDILEAQAKHRFSMFVICIYKIRTTIYNTQVIKQNIVLFI